MISAVRGTIHEVTPGGVQVDTGSGLILQVHCPVSSFDRMRKNQEILLHTVLRHKDEESVLYGFISLHEKWLFEKLIAISGVGGKTALSVVSAFSVRDLQTAIESADVEKLSSIPGIGRKTAQRIVLELTGKLDVESRDEEPGGGMREDIISGLINLGYPARKVKDPVRRVLDENPEETSFEILFKKAVREISKQ